ncbi:MAG: hypothetical protein N2253_09050, partial [Bacteroidia bacterium]|nr:hypothetical protein [Bacteroidia bacterium]
MRAALLSLAALCWAQAQMLSAALYKYYSESDIAEVQEKAPLKWEGIEHRILKAADGTPYRKDLDFVVLG